MKRERPKFCPYGHPVALFNLRTGQPCPGCLASSRRAEAVQDLFASRAKRPTRCPRCKRFAPPANPGAALCRSCSRLSCVRHLIAREGL